MASLSLLDNTDLQDINSPSQPPRESLDQDLLQALESIGPNSKTVHSEISFLKQYIETFNFKRDHLRLKTLEYYQTQIQA